MADSQGRPVLVGLEDWFHWHCNGDWEHGSGIKIDTLDNPGWSVTVDIAETELVSVPFATVELERSDENWLRCSRTDREFEIHCGAQNLTEALGVFLEWAGPHKDLGAEPRFTAGERVELRGRPDWAYAGEAAVVEEVGRAATAGECREHQVNMGDPLYRVILQDGSSILLGEEYLGSVGSRDI